MPVSTTYIRISDIVPVGGTDLRLSEIELSSDGGTSTSTTALYSSSIAPSTGAIADLSDSSLSTEVYWPAAGGMPVLKLTAANKLGMEVFDAFRQGSGSAVDGQIASATVALSTDDIDYSTVVHIGALSSAAAINTLSTWTALAVILVENMVDTAGTAEALEDNLFFLEDTTSAAADSLSPQLVAVDVRSDTVGCAEALAFQYGYLNTSSDTADAVDTFAASTFTMYLEAIGLTDALTSGANTTVALTDSAALTDIIQQAINQIVADTAAGADTLNLSAALTLVDIANAVATQTSTYNSVMLVAELVATLEAFNGADSADIMETGVLSDAYAARVAALVALLESAQAIDTNTTLVHVMQSATDSAEGATAITSTGSLITALLADSALTTIRLNIGGELFTGWVLNTDTMAPSEYQFADRQFNSACKHGDTYLMAAEDGIYEFTEDIGVESVMTYIKTGKTDFGSDLKKRIVNSYIVYSASGNMVLKVTTSEYGQLQTRNYKMVPPSNSETTDVRRFDLGRGIKSRYWQFELVGDGVDCDIDEIGMLPIVLSRRI